MANTNEWTEFLETLSGMRGANETLLNDLQDIYRPGGQHDEGHYETDIELSHLMDRYPSIHDIGGLLHDVSIMESAEQYCNAAADFQHLHQQIMDISKPFRDIVINGPQNSTEVSLLESATMFLEPQEINHAVRDNIPVSAVATKIGQSKAMAITEELAKQYHEVTKEAGEAAAHNIEPIEQDVKALGREYGVLHEIAQSISEASLTDISPSESPDNKHTEHEQGGDFHPGYFS